MFYGDLSAIPEADLQHIDDLVMDNLVSVLMEPGDVVLVDNYQVMHGRDVFTGERLHASVVRVSAMAVARSVRMMSTIERTRRRAFHHRTTRPREWAGNVRVGGDAQAELAQNSPETLRGMLAHTSKPVDTSSRGTPLVRPDARNRAGARVASALTMFIANTFIKFMSQRAGRAENKRGPIPGEVGGREREKQGGRGRCGMSAQPRRSSWQGGRE